MTHQWDPQGYLAYSDERARPFVELLRRVQADAPASVVDLGCGPGNLTEMLAERWPSADVTGVDASPEMIAAAPKSRVTYQVGDLREWAGSDDSRADVLVSNATLQWVPDHLDLLPRLLESVNPGGWLAIQVPGNFAMASHAIRLELAAEPRFREHLAGAEEPGAYDAATYLRALQGEGVDVDAWETTYLHVLHGDDPVYDWIMGTSARPMVAALPEDLREEFTDELRRRLRAAYPETGHGVVMPFRRVFVVARRRR